MANRNALFYVKFGEERGIILHLVEAPEVLKKTSLSMCILIQPQPLLTELMSMQGADGFLDRFLFMVTRPCMHKTNVVAEAYANLRENRIWDFVPVFDNIRPDWSIQQLAKHTH